MSREYQPTGMGISQLPAGTYVVGFNCELGSDETLQEGDTTFDGNTRIQTWEVVSGSGSQPFTSAAYARQAGETSVTVQIKKDDSNVGSDTTQYPD